MANRYTDSGKWDDPWFRKLSCRNKAFWLFLLDKCNHAGIWKVDFESASFHIGEEINEEEIKTVLSGRIVEFKDKWFIPKFIIFQYGVLSENNKVHLSVINILKNEGLYKDYRSTLEASKDKDKDIDMVTDKDMDKDNDEVKNDIEKVYAEYPTKCPVKGSPTGKSSSDKEKIKRKLKEYTADDLVNRIKLYVAQCQKTKTYIKNFATWLNNIPDIESLEKSKPKSYMERAEEMAARQRGKQDLEVIT